MQRFWATVSIMSSQIVTYQIDDCTVVKFEIEPSVGFQLAGPQEVVGQIRDAIAPALEAAKIVLEKAKDATPDQVEARFGIKASGEANWFVAKAAGEGNFEVSLTWRHHDRKIGAGKD